MIEALIDSGYHHIFFTVWITALCITITVLSSIMIISELNRD